MADGMGNGAEDRETTQRVEGALYQLRLGLTPFVKAHMERRHGAGWLRFASRAAGGRPDAPLDAYGLLKTVIDNWADVFRDAFPRTETQKVRNFASTALEARNATAHLALPLGDDEALRYLDAIHWLLKAVKAPAAQVAEAKALYDAQRRSGLAEPPPESRGPSPAPSPAPTPSSRPTLALGGLAPAPEAGSARPLRPWIEVALPHPDVLANRFREAEFAADLAAVDSGHAGEDYATPESFFRITYLTEGLRRILLSALGRLSGRGGDPVIGLQTAFGGGKTHTMLAVYHLARARDLQLLEGAGALAEKAGVAAWTPPKVAVFVGTSKGADTSLILKDGPRVHTLWGYVAWRLAGQAGLDLMAEAEAARTNPGSDLLVELFKLSGPALILLDELVAYARQLPEERFEAFLSFVQSLTEAAKMAPGILVIGSLPESKAEAGGPKGEAALLRLEKVFGRVQSAWLPASGDETYEIIRRRLFQALDADGERARDETVKAFGDIYKANADLFPPETKEARYRELLRLAYPIHPELFDRLSKDWASLPNFQRTRGVLRFMANVVGVLWQEQARHPLITPAWVPIGHERVRASALYPLDPHFAAVVDKEVDGPGSLPSQMEANPSRRIAQARAATRAARSVFLCSAPLAGRPNAGLTAQGLRLACAEPGDQLAIFGEALRELGERATYLYEEGGRHWFSTEPTLNRLAEERARALPDHEVDEAITRVLRDDGATRANFAKVYAAPDDPAATDEASALSLVILGPATPHAGKGAAPSRATEAATEALLRCRSGQRRHRNTLMFVAPDEALLATAREAMRKTLAWEDMCQDARITSQLKEQQIKDTKEKARTSRDGAEKAVRLAWSHIFFPVKTGDTAAGQAFDLDHRSLSTKDRAAIPSAVYEKVSSKGDGIAKDQLGPDTLWHHLEPLWPEERPHLGVDELVDWFASFVYLPKLRDRLVLDAAIREAVGKLDPRFGYADSVDGATGRLQGLAWAKAAPDRFPATAVLVRADVAAAQAAPKLPPGMEDGGRGFQGAGGATPTSSDGSEISEDGSKPGKPRRFYGAVDIDMVRPVKAFEAVLNAVALELQRTPGAKVRITLEIEAEADGGFDEADVGVVRDNARQLKFQPTSTGFE